MSEPRCSFLPYPTLCTRLQSCSWGPCSASGRCLHCKFCIWCHRCVTEGEKKSLDFYWPMSEKCYVDHYHGDCCSAELHLKRSLQAWTCIKSKQWHFISLGGMDSVLEHLGTQSDSFLPHRWCLNYCCQMQLLPCGFWCVPCAVHV